MPTLSRSNWITICILAISIIGITLTLMGTLSATSSVYNLKVNPRYLLTQYLIHSLWSISPYIFLGGAGLYYHYSSRMLTSIFLITLTLTIFGSVVIFMASLYLATTGLNLIVIIIPLVQWAYCGFVFTFKDLSKTGSN